MVIQEYSTSQRKIETRPSTTMMHESFGNYNTGGNVNNPSTT